MSTNWFIHCSQAGVTKNLHGKKFGADADPSGGAVAFSGGELCDYAFGYAAFPLWVSSCPFLREQFFFIYMKVLIEMMFPVYIYFLVHYDLFTNNLTSMLRF